MAKVDPEEVAKILRREKIDDLNLRFNGNIANLDFNDYVYINEYLESKPFEFTQTKNPIHPYQRDILDDDELVFNNCIGNVKINESIGVKKKTKKEYKDKAFNISTFRDDKSLIIPQNPKLRDDFIESEQTGRIYTSTRIGASDRNPKIIYKKFGDLM